MNITRVAIFDYLYDKITEAKPDVYVVGRYEPVPVSIPAVFIREMREISERDNMTFSGVQGVKTVTMEVHIITNGINNAMSENEGIESIVEQAFQELHFRRTFSNVIDDGSNGMYRLRITYERTIGDADEMPSEEEEAEGDDEVEDITPDAENGNDDDNGGEDGDVP